MMEEQGILLVDDEKEFVDTLAERISLRLMNPVIAYSGLQALDILKNSQPGIMVLDLNMPDMDGTEVLLKAKKAYPSLKIIILTGHGDEADRISLMDMGASGYLQKPVDLNTLLDTIYLFVDSDQNRGQ